MKKQSKTTTIAKVKADKGSVSKLFLVNILGHPAFICDKEHLAEVRKIAAKLTNDECGYKACDLANYDEFTLNSLTAFGEEKE